MTARCTETHNEEKIKQKAITDYAGNSTEAERLAQEDISNLELVKTD